MEQPNRALEDRTQDNSEEERVEKVKVRFVDDVKRRTTWPVLAKELSSESSIPREHLPEDRRDRQPNDGDQTHPRRRP